MKLPNCNRGHPDTDIDHFPPQNPSLKTLNICKGYFFAAITGVGSESLWFLFSINSCTKTFLHYFFSLISLMTFNSVWRTFWSALKRLTAENFWLLFYSILFIFTYNFGEVFDKWRPLWPPFFNVNAKTK